MTMRLFYLFGLFLLSTPFFAQNQNIKIDTIYFSGKIPKIADSNMKKILFGINIKCDENQEKVNDNKIESNREFRTISNLKFFNKEAKTSIFTKADAVIVSYFCQDIDYVDGVEFYEFIFEDEKSAKESIERLEYLLSKQGFNDYIGFKNWFFRRVNDKVYFIDARQEDKEGSIKNQLKKNIQLI